MCCAGSDVSPSMVSDVWKFCTRLSSTNVMCNQCGRVMSYHGTTNLRVHIGRHFGLRPERNGCGRTLKEKNQTATTAFVGELTAEETRSRLVTYDSVAEEATGPREAPHVDPSLEVCLRWFKHHTNLHSLFVAMLRDEEFVDVSLAISGKLIKCHKVILSACSPYLDKVLRENPCRHSLLIMNDFRFSDVEKLVSFMYRGEVCVSQDDLPMLLAAAEALSIKGLSTKLPTDCNGVN
ncbi:hypothetical protein PR048_003839 [Dryococelus australis]|uniref:BTB domain-containing protein n=1 Tax=Dryococelus australis TaxID=614101 RepID=A0ABQ9IQ90_9NEOP|nr:hypothetical protein PR048_003839 [Dryococelus australis]